MDTEACDEEDYNLDAGFMTCPLHFQSIISEIDILMSGFTHTKKDIGYGYRRTFMNGQRVDCIDYGKKGTTILRVGRGAWFVRTYPLLHGLFDEVAKVIAKLEISNVSVLHDKHILGLFALLDQAPKGIGAFD